jgi:hypothetical protein
MNRCLIRVLSEKSPFNQRQSSEILMKSLIEPDRSEMPTIGLMLLHLRRQLQAGERLAPSSGRNAQSRLPSRRDAHRKGNYVCEV